MTVFVGSEGSGLRPLFWMPLQPIEREYCVGFPVPHKRTEALLESLALQQIRASSGRLSSISDQRTHEQLYGKFSPHQYPLLHPRLLPHPLLPHLVQNPRNPYPHPHRHRYYMKPLNRFHFPPKFCDPWNPRKLRRFGLPR